MTRAALALAAAAVFGCTSTQKVSAPLPAEGKPMAPVSVEAELGEQGARVTVHFERDASQVVIAVSGLEGLVVTSAARPLSELSAPAGGATSFDVRYRPGPGRSALSVNVVGVFGGVRAMRVVTFELGQPTAEQLTSPGTVIDSGGDRVKVMPVSPAP